MRKEGNIIFISHSAMDKSIGYSVYEFLQSVIDKIPQLRKYRIFFAPETLSDKLNKNWRDLIVEALKNTYSFISIYTPNSLYSRWLNFETGVIHKLNKDNNVSINIVPLATVGVDIDKAIFNENSICRISSFEALRSNLGFENKELETNHEIEVFLKGVFPMNTDDIRIWIKDVTNKDLIWGFRSKFNKRIVEFMLL